MTDKQIIENIGKILHSWKDPYNNGYKGLCEKFAGDVYRQAGAYFEGSCCSGRARWMYGIKDHKLIDGDIIYAGENYHNEICPVCGRWCGHTGIYWDGFVFGAQLPYKWTRTAWEKHFGYGGHSSMGRH